MLAPPASTCSYPEIPAGDAQRLRAECVYRGITLASMLLLLASLWAF
jgi:hypothetical protein